MNVSGIQKYNHYQPLPVSPDVFDKMQHDIRGPLCAILGAAELLSASASTPRQQDMADALKESSETLKSRIDALGRLIQTDKLLMT